jgi:Flp pilus assembly pilin Flp
LSIPEREGVFIMIERLLGLSLSDESGQTMAEYAVVLGVITIAVVVTLGLLSTAIQNTLNNVISVI